MKLVFIFVMSVCGLVLSQPLMSDDLKEESKEFNQRQLEFLAPMLTPLITNIINNLGTQLTPILNNAITGITQQAVSSVSQLALEALTKGELEPGSMMGSSDYESYMINIPNGGKYIILANKNDNEEKSEVDLNNNENDENVKRMDKNNNKDGAYAVKFHEKPYFLHHIQQHIHNAMQQKEQLLNQTINKIHGLHQYHHQEYPHHEHHPHHEYRPQEHHPHYEHHPQEHHPNEYHHDDYVPTKPYKPLHIIPIVNHLAYIKGQKIPNDVV